jgi:hypothetical protein
MTLIPYSYVKPYRHLLVTGFGYLLAIMGQKTCGLKITGNRKNTSLPIKVKLIPMLIKTWERSHPLHKDCKYQQRLSTTFYVHAVYSTVVTWTAALPAHTQYILQLSLGLQPCQLTCSTFYSCHLDCIPASSHAVHSTVVTWTAALPAHTHQHSLLMFLHSFIQCNILHSFDICSLCVKGEISPMFEIALVLI